VKRIVLALALLLAPAAGSAQEPGIVPFEVAIAGLAAEDPTTRGAAARELAFQGRPEATAAILAALLKPEPDPWVRKDFYAALGQLGGPGVLDALLGCLAEESREELVGECAAALGNLGDPAALPVLLALAELKPASQLVRLRAIDALGFFADAGAERALTALLGDPAAGVRRHAIAALAVHGTGAAADALLEHLIATADDYEATLAAQALGRIGQRVDLSAAVPRLAALLVPTSSARLFGTAAYALGSIASEPAVAVLSAVLHGLPLERQWEVVRALGRSGNPLAVPSLLAELALAADYFLADAPNLVAPEGAPNLVAPEGAWSERLAVMQALCEALLATGPLGTAAVAAPLAAAAPPVPADADGAVIVLQAAKLVDLRLAAIDLLGADRGSGTALAALLALATGDPIPRVRPAAALALGRLGRVEAVPPLAALLDPAQHRTLRWSAAMALGELGDASALPALELAAANDPDALVRRAATEAAARIASGEN